MEKRKMILSFSEFELIALALAVETLVQTLNSKQDIDTILPLVRKTRIAAEVGEGGGALVELTFSGLSTGGEK